MCLINIFSLNTSKQELRIKWSIVVPKHIWKVESTHRCYSFATGIYWAVTCILDLHFFHMHTNYRSYALHIYWGEELWRANSSCINTSTWWLELTITLHLLKRQLPATCICVWVRYQRYKTCIYSFPRHNPEVFTQPRGMFVVEYRFIVLLLFAGIIYSYVPPGHFTTSFIWFLSQTKGLSCSLEHSWTEVD